MPVPTGVRRPRLSCRAILANPVFCPQQGATPLSSTPTDPTLEEACVARGMRMTDQRRTIARIIEGASDHPDVEELYRRAAAIDPRISLSTVYRTVNLFEEAGLVTKHDFKDGRARFELIPDEHHDHLIDIRSGTVIEFRNEEIEAIQEVIAKRLGYKLIDHRLELYAVPLPDKATEKS
jgi:Fur family transcriptional regulator, ferric uptake regulator